MMSSEQPLEVQISFQDGDSETLLVTPMGPNLYRMEERCILIEARYHDIIQTELRTDGSLRFLRVVTTSGLKTESWVLPPALVGSPLLSALLDEVMAIGGNWERIFGGLLLLHLPPAEHDCIVAKFNSLFGEAPRDTPDH